VLLRCRLSCTSAYLFFNDCMQIALMGSSFSEDGRKYAYSLASGGSGMLTPRLRPVMSYKAGLTSD